MFEIKKRTQHGYPLSSLGICLGDYELTCLANLRFADDVLLFATTQEQLQKMMCEFKHSTEKVGLKIHPGKDGDS